MTKKQKDHMRVARVPRHLQAAREALVDALNADMDLEKFTVALHDGHKLTLEELHTWLIGVIEQYEKHGPRRTAQKLLDELVASQRAN